MNEVEKLYKNAGINCKPNYVYNKVPILRGLDYPPFTAEKQLELIKFLMEIDFSWVIASQGEDTKFIFYVGYEHSSGDFKEFTEALAEIINNIWQDLTEEKRKQIKDILK